MSKYVLEKKLFPITKYPGGKEKELTHIIPHLPDKINNYYEPFVGGGAVYFTIKANKYFINDKSDELILLYKMIKTQNKEFIDKLEAIEYNWQIISNIVDFHKEELIKLYKNYKNNFLNEQQLSEEITQFVLSNKDEFNGLLDRSFNYQIDNFINELFRNIKNKMVRMNKMEKAKGDISHNDLISNIECSFKSAFYMHFRYLINNKNLLNLSDGFSSAIYFFIRQTCYSSMFRYNKSGKFNVPYGGISYNRKSFKNKINYFKDKNLINHLDPPYDTEFSTYARNEFNKSDQKRLSDYLINECKANWMLIIKNTEYISDLYKKGIKTANNQQLSIFMFDKKYLVSFQDRNNKEAKHLLITNYKLNGE